MEKVPVHDIVRQFPDRAMRWALELPENVRGLLRLADLPHVEDLDFSAMRPLKTSSLHDDLREEIPDVLVEIPLRLAPERRLVVCILAEHSSTQIPYVQVHIIERMGNVWRDQRRQWEQENTPPEKRIPKPVISGVLYTGETPWSSPQPLSRELQLPSALGRYVPNFEVFLVDPSQLSKKALDRPDEPFAWLLKLFRDQRASRSQFLGTLREVLERLSGLPKQATRQAKRLAWIADLMAYHRRPKEERPEIFAIIKEIVPRFVASEEVGIMSQTIAEYYVEQGIQKGLQKGKQDLLLRLLETRFGKLSERVKQKVRSIQDESALDELSVKILTAKGLKDLKLL